MDADVVTRTEPVPVDASGVEHFAGDVDGEADVEVVGHSVRLELMAGLAALDPVALDSVDAAVVGRPTPTRAPHAPAAAVVLGDAAPRRIDVRCVVGRPGAATGAATELALTDPLVSRRHVEIWADGDAVLCRDLGSRNGTVRVRDGVRHVVGTTAATMLLAGDVLVTADDVLLLRIVDPT